MLKINFEQLVATQEHQLGFKIEKDRLPSIHGLAGYILTSLKAYAHDTRLPNITRRLLMECHQATIEILKKENPMLGFKPQLTEEEISIFKNSYRKTFKIEYEQRAEMEGPRIKMKL